MPTPLQPLDAGARPGLGASRLLDPGFVRRAGQTTLLAIGTLGASAVALSLYFGGAGEVFGPINDTLVAASFALLAPAVLAVQQLGRGITGRWLDAVSAAALAGIGVAVIGQLLLVAGVLPLAGSFVTLGVGALLVVAWTGALTAVSLRDGVLSRSVGWWALALIAVTAVTAVGTPVAGLGTAALSVVFGIPLLVATVGLLASLGRDLLRRG
ncbi:MAG TPA: hypothetical protein VLA23_09715 [Candidatus Limnocylindrales bacterium]|nr:hypothetical protein [Candidatus Limnocylindrales bacterium]